MLASSLNNFILLIINKIGFAENNKGYKNG